MYRSKSGGFCEVPRPLGTIVQVLKLSEPRSSPRHWWACDRADIAAQGEPAPVPSSTRAVRIPTRWVLTKVRFRDGVRVRRAINGLDQVRHQNRPQSMLLRLSVSHLLSPIGWSRRSLPQLALSRPNRSPRRSTSHCLGPCDHEPAAQLPSVPSVETSLLHHARRRERRLEDWRRAGDHAYGTGDHRLDATADTLSNEQQP